MAEMGGGELDAGTLILPILERITDPKINRQQIDTQVELNRTLLQLIKTFEGFNSAYKGGGGGGAKGATNKNPLQPQAPSSLMSAFSWMGEKKDKAVEFIKKGFFKLFKTDYFGNLLKSVGALAKALGNTFMSWLKFFIMMAFIDPSGGFMRDIINLFTQIGMIVFKTVMPLIPVAIKMMFDTIVYVFKLVLKMMPQIISIIMQTFTQLGNTFPILKPIIGFINRFLGALKSLFVVLNDPKADKGEGFKTFLKKVFVILVDLVVGAVKLILKYLPLIIKGIVDFIKDDLIPGLLKLIPEFLDSISIGIDELIKSYPELDAWLSPIKKFINVISNFIKEISSPESTIDFSFITKTIDLLKDILILVKDVFMDIVETIWDALGGEEGVSAIFSDISETFSAIFTRLADFFNNYIKPTVEMAMPIIKRVVSFLVQGLVWGFKLFLKILPYIVDLLLLLPKIVWKYVYPIFLKLIDIFMDIVDAVKIVYNWIAEFSVKVYKYFGELIDDILNLFSSWYNNVVKFKDDIVNAFSNAWDSFVKWWDTVDIMGPLKNAGLMVIEFLGLLADGFYDEFIKPMVDMWDDLIDFFKNIKLPDWLSNIFGGMGGGTDADELNNSNKNLPYDPQTDPKYKKALLDSAIDNQSMVTKLTNSPDNINKMIREDQKAKKSINYYDKITKPFADELSQSVKDGIKIKAPTIDIGGSMPKADTNWFDDFSFKLKKMFTSVFEWINGVLPDWFPGKSKTSTFDKIFSITNTKNAQEFQQTESVKKEIESLGGLKTSAIKHYLENSEFYREQANQSGGEEKYLQTYLGATFSKNLYDALMRLRNDAYQNKPTDNTLIIKAGNAIITSKKTSPTK